MAGQPAKSSATDGRTEKSASSDGRKRAMPDQDDHEHPVDSSTRPRVPVASPVASPVVQHDAPSTAAICNSMDPYQGGSAMPLAQQGTASSLPADSTADDWDNLHGYAGSYNTSTGALAGSSARQGTLAKLEAQEKQRVLTRQLIQPRFPRLSPAVTRDGTTRSVAPTEGHQESWRWIPSMGEQDKGIF